jgi:hypothetical protein
MKNLRELLRDADPLRREPMYSRDQRDLCRQAVLVVASGAQPRAGVKSRSRIGVVGTVALMLLAASLVGLRLWSPFVSEVQAAIQFEIRLAEERPAPGLREAKVSGSDRSVYLYDEAIVTNSDIAAARVVPGGGPAQYYVHVKFNAAGAEKMRAATQNHIGTHLAMLINGQVTAAPMLRTAISTSAVISGNFTRAQAERIVNGIGIR